jgi:hydrophobic/amphiphilic exporter-1 (mainly G- bacteria), HAE1 family
VDQGHDQRDVHDRHHHADGLVTKNGILLIDFVNQARGEGKDRLTAILEAGRIRLRPIIMTTAAMIFGMLPLALAIGEGAEQRAPMAHAVIGGLITSTILTLFVVPAVYTILDDLSSGWARRREARATSEAPAPETPVLAHEGREPRLTAGGCPVYSAVITQGASI